MPLSFIDNSFVLGGIQFIIEPTVNIRKLKSEGDKFYIMKTRDMVSGLYERFQSRKVDVVVEFGIQRGGSVAFFNELLRPKLHVCIELDNRDSDALEMYEKRVAEDGRCLTLCYGTNQGDKSAVKRIISDALSKSGIAAVDFVIDDASHLYAPSRNSFETVFPMMKSGGVYILEDWAWAHWPGYQSSSSPYSSEPALTNLVLEMAMLCGTRRDLLPQLIVNGGFVFAQRGPAAIDDHFDIRSSILTRSKTFIGI